MKIVGLDISLTSAGWCTITDAGRSFDHIEPPPESASGLGRIWCMSRAITEIARGADLVVIEDFAFNRFNQQGHAELIGLSYVVRLWLFKTGIPMLLVAPASAKKFVLHGKADKSLIVREVLTRWNCEVENNDEADAVVLAEIGRAWLDPEQMLTVPQREVIGRLREKEAGGGRKRRQKR